MLDALEEEVVPLYYAATPRAIRRMGAALQARHDDGDPAFNMGRVVQDYARGVYYPAARTTSA
jgi:hypothetical protein